jgi:UDP-2,3-diacylglucosamine hydrolase
MVRGAAWQDEFLSRPLEARRAYARDVRQQSEMRKKGLASPADWADVDAPAAVAWLQRAGTVTLIHGHTHRPAVHELQLGDRECKRIVLGDWYEQGSVLRVDADGYRLESLPT